MTHTYEELKKKTLAQLREIAKEIQHEAVQGYSQLHKEPLLTAICKALNVDMHAHHEVVGIDKTELKAQIRALKRERDEALAAHDHAQLKTLRRQIHELKHRIHRSTLLTHPAPAKAARAKAG